MSNCYFCCSPATKKLELKPSFTAHSRARCPQSDKICDACEWAINSQCWYWNPTKAAWSKLFTRVWSWLLSADKSYPTFGESPKNDKHQLVENLPTRELIREWLINPPEPPFTIAIAESGQKHIFPFRTESKSRDVYPVLFEEDTLWVNRVELIKVLGFYEQLMSLGFSKTEINSGDYRSDRLMSCLERWQELEGNYRQYRGTLLAKLLSHVAQKPPAIAELP